MNTSTDRPCKPSWHDYWTWPPHFGVQTNAKGWRLRCDQEQSRRQQWLTSLGLDCLGG